MHTKYGNTGDTPVLALMIKKLEASKKQIYILRTSTRVSVRTGRLGKFIYRATAPEPDRRIAPPGASRYGFSTNTIDSPSQVSRDSATTTGGRPAHQGRGRRSYFGRRNGLSFSFTFGVLFFWLPRRRVWRCHRARFTHRGGTADRKQVKMCAAIV